jgi:CRP/FNR family transcriptional regulator, cyclic AMP receptor protein
MASLALVDTDAATRLDAGCERVTTTMTVAHTAEVLDQKLLGEIAAKGTVRRFPAQAIIISEGDTTGSLYVILEGRVRVFADSAAGKTFEFGTHGPGEYVGELALDGGARSASVMTLERTTCAIVDSIQLRQFVADHPDFATHLIHKLIRKVREASDKVKSLALMDAYGRVARLLLELADNVDGQLTIQPRPTQMQIGRRVGCSREMVSRILRDLERGQYIAVEKSRIVLHRKLPPRW